MSLSSWNLLTDFINGNAVQPPNAATVYSSRNQMGVGGLPSPTIGLPVDPPAPQPPAGSDGTINGAKAVVPTYKTLDFDPEGPGHWGAAIQHPFDAKTASDLADEANTVTQKEFSNDAGGLENDEADAFRHAYWSLRMSQAFGPEIAKKFSDAHEISVPNSEGERLMDLYNNQIGRGLNADAIKGKEVETVKKAIHNNLLRTRKF